MDAVDVMTICRVPEAPASLISSALHSQKHHKAHWTNMGQHPGTVATRTCTCRSPKVRIFYASIKQVSCWVLHPSADGMRVESHLQGVCTSSRLSTEALTMCHGLPASLTHPYAARRLIQYAVGLGSKSQLPTPMRRILCTSQCAETGNEHPCQGP